MVRIHLIAAQAACLIGEVIAHGFVAFLGDCSIVTS